MLLRARHPEFDIAEQTPEPRPMEILDGPLRAALPAVPTLLRRCLELLGDDFMLKLRQQLFALAQAEPQRRQFADVRTRHASGTLVIWPSPLSTARISSNFMRNLRRSTGTGLSSTA